MAPTRRNQGRRQRHSSFSLSIATNINTALPPISALFLIDFDVKAGYTITWKRTVPNLELDGQVEYKSLPSGLHTVRDDLIYFVHDGAHAGLSAFVNEPCEEEEARNARMIAVGILVPLSYGRLGRAWRHAENLKDLAAKLAKDRNQTNLLEKYWETSRSSDNLSSQPYDSSDAHLPDSPTQERRPQPGRRSVSDGTSLLPSEQRLSPFHPAWSLTKLLDTFGPLIFPIHRAALLRKRILISCHAPVHETCDFVYDISVLSNIPLSVADKLPQSSPTSRLRPLFNIGVHDIPFLMDDFEAFKRRQDGTADLEDEAGSGWIACTTDSILAMKDTLWDMLITMPPRHSWASPSDKAWPTVEYPRGTPVKATQRDLRRFSAMRSALVRVAMQPPSEEPESPVSESSAPRLSSHSHRLVKDEEDESVNSLIEPLTWSALAYNGYMWWASAGEQIRSEEQEESSRDAALLADLAPSPRTPLSAARPEFLSESLASLASSHRPSGHSDPDGEARTELAIIAYFHRLTTQMLSILVDLVDSADEAYPSGYRDEEDAETDGEDEAEVLVRNGGLGNESNAITVDSHSLETMGLDVWSATDAAFVQDLLATYFGRPARIEGKGVEVCGVRVC